MKIPVAIIGGGPAGSASAMWLRSFGIDCVVIERAKFPRYHIGESTTGECGASIRALGLEQEMMKRNYPIKRAAAIYGTGGYKWDLPVAGRDKDWNLTPNFTWQVRRSDFDKLMLDTAISRGAGFIEGQVLEPRLDDDGAVRGLTVRANDGTRLEIESEVVLDCSGQNTFLANAGVTGAKYNGNYDKQMAVFSQVAGTLRGDGIGPNDTLLFYRTKHQWAWFIPLDDDIVSVGVVAPAAYFKEQRESKSDYLRRELHELNPELTRRVPDTTLHEDVRSIPNYSYQVRSFCGKGYICVGDAHRFIDPIFSFGVCISLHEAKQAAMAARDYLAGKGRDAANPFADYAVMTEKGIDVVEDMMDAFWEKPFAFARIVHSQRDEMIDIFAGRLWTRQPSAATDKLRRMLNRERVYEGADGGFSVPIGSRYHPERAHLWDAAEQSA
jgi:flavin-dependent dehydrogenase